MVNKAIDEIFKDFLFGIQNQVTAAIIEGYNAGMEVAKKQISVKDTSKLLSRKEVAKYYSVSVNTIDKYVKEDIIPAYRFGSTIRFKAEELPEILFKRKFKK